MARRSLLRRVLPNPHKKRPRQGRLINAHEYLWLATNYRIVNIRGHVGSGKTLLAVATAYELWRKKYIERIFAPFPLKGQSLEFDNGEDFVMILDEAHVVLDSREFGKNASKDWLRDIRKRRAVIISSAFIDVDKRFRLVMVQRILKVGNLLWWYRWQMSDGVGQSTGAFGLLNPNWYFNTYPTKYSPNDEDFNNMLKVVSSGNPRGNKDSSEQISVVSLHTDEDIQFEKQIKPDDWKVKI